MLQDVSAPEGLELDYRFSLANERTFLAWTRTALALIAGGVAAAKALEVHHELVRWVIAVPPIVAGSVIGVFAGRRWRTYEEVMRRHGRLPVGRGVAVWSCGVAVYALVVLVAVAVDS